MLKHVLFAGFGFLLLVGTFFLFGQEARQEWKRLQKAFYTKSLQRLQASAQQGTDPQEKARLEAARRRVAEQRVAIKQLYIEPLQRTDRCITCHLGIDDPSWQEAEQPFTSHPPPLLRYHPPETYGCTICHRGQGLATTTEAAHGKVKHWPTPLLPKAYLEASCARCHQEQEFRAAPVLSEGRRFIGRLGCPGCHTIRGYTPHENIGPSLAFIGSKVSSPWLLRYLKDPAWYSPASRMPDFKLSDAEAAALTAFLLTLRQPEDAQQHPTPLAPHTPEMIAPGKQRIIEAGCVSCHSIAGIPVPGFFAPDRRGGDLRAIAHKVQPAWLLRFFQHRAAVQPASRMPTYHFTETEAHSVVAYLMAQESAIVPVQDDLSVSPSPDTVAEGKKLVLQYNCVGCHEIPGIGTSNPGPPLVDIGDQPVTRLDFGTNPKGAERSLHTWLFAKVMTPRTFRETLWMPYFRLTMPQTKALVTFLLGQVADDLPATYQADTQQPSLSPLSVPGGRVGALLQTYQCLQCHTIAGQGSRRGPDLTVEGSRVQKDWLLRYLQDPVPLRPLVQARMPNFGMGQPDAAVLAEYITLALVDARLPPEPVPLPPLTDQEQRQGKRLFGRTYGCNACHQLGGVGGRVGPDLTDVAKRLRPEWLRRYVQRPQELVPDTLMPDLGLSADEADVLARYLWNFPPP
jgi:mono/diheme cytochrome c family protein